MGPFSYLAMLDFLSFLETNEKAMGSLVTDLWRWMPEDKAVLECVGVDRLALEGMRIEIEALATRCFSIPSKRLEESITFELELFQPVILIGRHLLFDLLF